MAVALTVIQPQAVKTLCDCPPGDCDFSISRVYFYLIVWDEAQRVYREPFDVVLRDRTRSSSICDPAIRGGRGDQNKARAIQWALEQARDVHHIPLVYWNAAKIARALCPARYNETD